MDLGSGVEVTAQLDARILRLSRQGGTASAHAVSRWPQTRLDQAEQALAKIELRETEWAERDARQREHAFDYLKGK